MSVYEDTEDETKGEDEREVYVKARMEVEVGRGLWYQVYAAVEQ